MAGYALKSKYQKIAWKQVRIGAYPTSIVGPIIQNLFVLDRWAPL